ncbi:hypothetical protein PPERSA_07490 [Pseudocohnilembus persalinus]|uniref:Peptidase A22B, signal peptide peptidase n=1 Tax=Pseudocohnilembus persalinus TaxID=266149 RepID=A0A0V0R2E2_PSEPJ|nr:hypothetical protein PPERSA_07490 [Pseudocohnilembus persalinus]|eukprot:KRX08678.1 hypothetical protein PPERSA_07490 [Pseudocohnilembus persalinus]
MSSEPIIIRPMACVWMILTLVGIHIAASAGNFPAFFQLFIQSTLTVYLGCFLCNKVRVKDKKIVRQEKEESQETMSSKDAMQFPLYGSLVLFSLYGAYKLLPSEWLNVIFTIYFSFIGLLCLANFIEMPVSKILGARKTQEYKDLIVIDRKFKLNLVFTVKDIELKLNYFEMICLSVSVFPTIYYGFTKNWICNNIFGIAFSIIGIGNLSLPNFKTGFILLWGLFFYDIFWVYGTDVMVTVAKNFNVPIKLMFPYQWVTDGENPGPKFSMLGLGDIVIPGIFVALCLKYDLDQRLSKVKNVHSISTPIFNWCYGGYVAGIITTYAVLVYFNHAQPALLFLVPGCTIGTLVGALLNGGIKQLFGYTEEVEEKQQKKSVKNDESEELKEKESLLETNKKDD